MDTVSNLPIRLRIEQLDSRGRGTVSHAGATIVCDGALPGEWVNVEHYRQSRHQFIASTYAIEQPVAARVTPQCPEFGNCGGCQLQHLDYSQQLAFKKELLRKTLADYGGVATDNWLPVLSGNPFNYRRRVRLGVRQLSDGEFIIGFHRKSHSYLMDINTCPILEPNLQRLLLPLHELVQDLSVRNSLPQIEMCNGDNAVAVVFRHLRDLSPKDMKLLHGFAEQYTVLVFTQAGGPDSIQPLAGSSSGLLEYNLPAQHIRLLHGVNDFIQANARVNAMLVQRVLDLLAPTTQDQILDLYSGMGNFSLALARRARSVTGIEAHPGLVARARDNAERNNLDNVQFLQGDLNSWQAQGYYTKVLLDPPREGAIRLVKQIAVLDPSRIVYISCLPRTLARDARYLVHVAGYRLSRVGLVDMFPQTRHIEAIAVFEK